MNHESFHSYELWVMSLSWIMSQITPRSNESCHTHESWVMSILSHVTLVNELKMWSRDESYHSHKSCHAHEWWVISHSWTMSHVTLINDEWLQSYESWVMSLSWIMSYVTLNGNESCHTHESWFMSILSHATLVNELKVLPRDQSYHSHVILSSHESWHTCESWVELHSWIMSQCHSYEWAKGVASEW